MGDFKILNTLGKGTFGKVKKALYLPTGNEVAIKIMEKAKLSSKKDVTRIKRQMKILKQISHPNITQLYQIQDKKQTYNLIMQLAQGKELYEQINRVGSLSEDEAGTYFIQLIDAVSYLHSKSICHRDIKPENIIVDGPKLKLIDFGLSNYYRFKQHLYTSCGSPCYAAPQMIDQKNYKPQKVDVWALGVTLYAMLSGRLPFQHENTKKLYKMIKKGIYEEIPNISSSLKGLIRSMLEADSELRVSLEQIREHVWVRSFGPQFYKEQKVQLNDLVLRQMKEKFEISVDQIKATIEERNSNLAIYYFMRIQNLDSNPPVLNNQSQQMHKGPIHLNFIFQDSTKIKAFLFQKFPDIEWFWSSENEAKGNFYTIKIKKLKNFPDKLYLCFMK